VVKVDSYALRNTTSVSLWTGKGGGGEKVLLKKNIKIILACTVTSGRKDGIQAGTKVRARTTQIL
jgi:hypothetical protein